MSLLGSIFGTKNDDVKSGIFDTSISLPERPQHKDYAPPKAEQADTEQPTTRKKRKRKQDQSEETGHSKDAQTEALESEAKVASSIKPDEEEKTTLPEADDDVANRTIFVGNLPLSTTRKSLAALFKSCGKIESTRLRSVAAAGVKLPPERAGDQNLMKQVCANTNKVDMDAKTTAQGYVVFASTESIKQALTLNNTMMEKKRIRVDHANPTTDASRSVFVGNLPYHADETSLQLHFETNCRQKNIVEGVRIVRDKDTMQCKGFGYVLFHEKSMVATALQNIPNTVYLKRPLRVQVCGKRTKNKRGIDTKKKRSFEGKRAETSIGGANYNTRSSTHKNRRARGEKKKDNKINPRKAGVSKRATAQAKAGKRIKQIQKRITKGMGKARR